MGAMPAFLYPYTSNTTMVVGKCNYKKEDVVQIVDGVCTQQMPVTEAKLKEILVRNGPVHKIIAIFVQNIKKFPH